MVYKNYFSNQKLFNSYDKYVIFNDPTFGKNLLENSFYCLQLRGFLPLFASVQLNTGTVSN